MTETTDRIGFHYFPDDQHFTQSDLETWLPILQSLNARWLVVRAGLDRAVPESFLRGLLGAGIQPIVRVAAKVSRLPEPELAPILQSYASWGVRHVVVFDRPNARESWGEPEWSRPALVERFLDLALPVLLAERSSGLVPVLPPLEPGGDYWDTAFLAAALDGLLRRGQASLLGDLALAIQAFTHRHPLDWGKGGPERWPEARPYHTPQGAQDQRGLHAFDWYAAVADAAGLPALPMLVVAGGALPGDGQPGFGPDPHAEENASIVRALMTQEIPATVVNFAFYLLSASPDHPDHAAAWFPSVDSPRPVVEAVQRALSSKATASPTGSKPIRHYLLLPSSRGSSLLQEWNTLAEFAALHRPALGFSPAEAKLATRVTLAGDEGSIPRSVEDQLRAAGCAVDRLVPASGEVIKPRAIPHAASSSLGEAGA
jgi:hypothetical protein